jgi:hypothetical protein
MCYPTRPTFSVIGPEKVGGVGEHRGKPTVLDAYSPMAATPGPTTVDAVDAQTDKQATEPLRRDLLRGPRERDARYADRVRLLDAQRGRRVERVLEIFRQREFRRPSS